MHKTNWNDQGVDNHHYPVMFHHTHRNRIQRHGQQHAINGKLEIVFQSLSRRNSQQKIPPVAFC